MASSARSIFVPTQSVSVHHPEAFGLGSRGPVRARLCSAFVRLPFGECSALVRAIPVWIMDDSFQEILDSLPEKRSRSRLEPYGRLIDELLRRGWTYRGIAGILAEKCQLQVSISTIHDFVRLRSRSKRSPSKRRAPEPSQKMKASTARAEGKTAEEQEIPPVDEVQQRIAALKQRPAPAQTGPKQFHYDLSEPLRLRPTEGKKRSAE